ncbi:MAG: hypothetical protein ACTHJ4_08920 [Candidatus Nucleicultricaceae bacterium]
MKITSLLFLLFFIFQSTPIFSMNEEEEINLGNIKTVAVKKEDQENTDKFECCNSRFCRSNKNCCTHWGLKRWFCGIKEYVIDRCVCCGFTDCGFDHIDVDRAYIKEEIGGYIVTTDCWLLKFRDACCIQDGWFSGTICFPVAMLTHLMCLPITCCYPNKDDWRETETERQRIETLVNGYKERKMWDKHIENKRKDEEIRAKYLAIDTEKRDAEKREQQILYGNRNTFNSTYYYANNNDLSQESKNYGSNYTTSYISSVDSGLSGNNIMREQERKSQQERDRMNAYTTTNIFWGNYNNGIF